jgi:hypothetical protein
VSGSWIRYREYVIPIRRGGVLLGRGADCDLVLDDPLVSRHHARISEAGDGVVVEDLSTNGVFIAGKRVAKQSRIQGQASLTVGNLVVEILPDAELSGAGQPETRRATFQTMPRNQIRVSVKDDDDDDAFHSRPGAGATDRPEMLHIMAPAAEQMLKDGKVEQAEDALAGRLAEALEHGAKRGRANPNVAPTAARCALLLADASGKVEWVEYPLKLYGFGPDALPIELVDELFRLVHKGVVPALQLVRQYVGALEGNANRLNPTGRFVLKRLQGLEQLIASR